MTKGFLIALGLPLALGACAVGPEYAGPPRDAAPPRPGFVRAGTVASDAPVVARWWDVLGDARLGALVDEALAHSPSITEGEARIREAMAVLRQRQNSGLPTVSPSVIAARADLPPFTASGQRSNLAIYNVGATASWEPDFWGADRRANEVARANIQQRQAQLADIQVSLSAQVAQAYVNLRDAQTRLALLDQLGAVRRRELALMQQRLAAGTASAQDTARTEGDLQTALAEAAPVTAQIEVALNQLAILTGKAPGDLDAVLHATAPLPAVPTQVAMGDPAALIARRPDIRAAERALAGSTAQVGATKAQLLPRLSFTGILGMGSTSLASVVDPATVAVGILPQLKWSGLDWGKGRAMVRQSQAQRDASEAQYHRIVLAALEDAESSLSRFGAARVRLAHLDAGDAAARHSATLGAERVAAGTSSGLEQLEREAARLQTSIAMAQGHAELVADYIAIAKALGLGWQG